MFETCSVFSSSFLKYDYWFKNYQMPYLGCVIIWTTATHVCVNCDNRISGNMLTIDNQPLSFTIFGVSGLQCAY